MKTEPLFPWDLAPEIANALEQVSPTLTRQQATRMIIRLAEQQLPGSEIRRLYLTIIAAAIRGALACKEHPETIPTYRLRASAE